MISVVSPDKRFSILKAASSAQWGVLHSGELLAFCFDASTFRCLLLLVTSSHIVEASVVNTDCDRCRLWVISTEDSGEANEDASLWDQLSFPGTWYFPCAIYFRGTHTRLWKWSQVSSFRTVLPFKKVTKVQCSLMYIVYITLLFFFSVSWKCILFFCELCPKHCHCSLLCAPPFFCVNLPHCVTKESRCAYCHPEITELSFSFLVAWLAYWCLPCLTTSAGACNA